VDYSLWPSWVIVGASVVVTAASAVTDFRSRRIPNWLTLTAFVLGLLFRLATEGTPGLLDAGLGFGAGFGTLFVLWVCGGGGAGDVKLMGALGVWLGLSLTLAALLLSVVIVCLLSLAAPLFSRQSTVVASTARPGDVNPAEPAPTATEERTARAVKEQVGDTERAAGPIDQPGQQKLPGQRMTVAFAIPVALATWIVLALDFAGVSFPLL
jgi:Flp pilus assembly protein protease CpaA